MIVCGWCGKPTSDGDACGSCGHPAPRQPWEQRATPVPVWSERDESRRRLATATAELRSEGTTPTIERLAERLDVSPRTVRRWREMST